MFNKHFAQNLGNLRSAKITFFMQNKNWRVTLRRNVYNIAGEIRAIEEFGYELQLQPT